MKAPPLDSIRPMALIAMMACITGSGLGAGPIYLPSLNAMAGDLNTSVAMVQLSFTAFLLGSAISQVFIGSISDRIGRRPVLLAGIALWVATSLFAGLAQGVMLLIVLRVAQSVGASTGPVLTRAIVRDLFDRNGAARAASLSAMANSLGPVLFVMLGGYFERFLDWRWTFFFMTAVAGVLGVWALFRMPETSVGRRPVRGLLRSMAVDYRALLSRLPILAYLSVNTTLMLGQFFMVAAAAPLALTALNLRPDEYGLWAAVSGLGVITGSFAASRLALRHGPDRMIDLGVTVAALTGVAMLVAALTGYSSALTIFGPLFLWQVAIGLAMPSSNAAAVSVLPDMAGAAAGLMGSLQIAAASVGSAVAAAMPADAARLFGYGVFAAAALLAGGWVGLRGFAISAARHG